MIKVDDRTPEQRKTHKWAVVAHDKFLSGWGQAKGGTSRVAWAIADSDIDLLDRLEQWVRNRSEMRYVNVVKLDTYRPPRGTAHFHVYVADREHPGLK